MTTHQPVHQTWVARPLKFLTFLLAALLVAGWQPNVVAQNTCVPHDNLAKRKAALQKGINTGTQLLLNYAQVAEAARNGVNLLEALRTGDPLIDAAIDAGIQVLEAVIDSLIQQGEELNRQIEEWEAELGSLALEEPPDGCTCNLAYCNICSELLAECVCEHCNICSELVAECTCVYCNVCSQLVAECTCQYCSTCNQLVAECTCQYCNICSQLVASCTCQYCATCSQLVASCTCQYCGTCNQLVAACTCNPLP